MSARLASDSPWHVSSLGVAQLEFLLWESKRARVVFPGWRTHLAESVFEAVHLSGWDDAFEWALEVNRARQNFALNPALLAHPWLAAAHEYTHYFSVSVPLRGVAQQMGLRLLPARLA